MGLFDGFFGSALGGLFGLAGSAMNQMMSFRDNKKLQENQARLNLENAQTSAIESPSWNRAGLTKAGYNPMLAVQNATSGVNSSWAGTASTQPVDYMSGISAGVANAQSLQRLTNETKTAEAQQDQAYALADKAKVEKNTMVEKLPFVSQREKAEIANVEKDSLLKESQIHNIDETTRFIEKRFELDQLLADIQRAGVGAQYASVGAQYANARANQTSAEAKTLSQVLGKYTEKAGKKSYPYIKDFLLNKFNSRFNAGGLKL